MIHYANQASVADTSVGSQGIPKMLDAKLWVLFGRRAVAVGGTTNTGLLAVQSSKRAKRLQAKLIVEENQADSSL